VLRAHVEGRAAAVGAANPYAGQSRVLAAAWLHGYKLMLRAMLAATTRLFVCGGSSMRYLRR